MSSTITIPAALMGEVRYGSLARAATAVREFDDHLDVFVDNPDDYDGHVAFRRQVEGWFAFLDVIGADRRVIDTADVVVPSEHAEQLRDGCDFAIYVLREEVRDAEADEIVTRAQTIARLEAVMAECGGTEVTA